MLGLQLVAQIEVKVWIVPESGVDGLDFAAMAERLAERMPAYMVPRDFELIDAFPTTPMLKVQKFALRDLGNSERTWDRLAGRETAAAARGVT